MNATELQQVRSMPLFVRLDDAQLGCIEPGEVIEVPAGTILVSEGERFPFFFVVLEGEVRLSRTYDRQTILMGVVKPGNFTGEVTLLFDAPWLSTARVDLNPHQVDVALFALSSTLSKGALLADEVGLGKTIEAGLAIAPRWAERKRHILLSCRPRSASNGARSFSTRSRCRRRSSKAAPTTRPGGRERRRPSSRTDGS